MKAPTESSTRMASWWIPLSAVAAAAITAWATLSRQERCIPNQEESCQCGVGSGKRVCTDDGAFSECECPTSVLATMGSGHRPPLRDAEASRDFQSPATAPATKPQIPAASVRVLASTFQEGENVAFGRPPTPQYGNVLMNAPPYQLPGPNAAKFMFNVGVAGLYQLSVKYAAASSRPVTIEINGGVVLQNAMAHSTGCWESECQKLIPQGTVRLQAGLNWMRVATPGNFAHIEEFVFDPAEGG